MILLLFNIFFLSFPDNVLIKPLLLQIDQIDAQVSQFEANAYRLDSYTKQLKARFKELEEK